MISEKSDIRTFGVNAGQAADTVRWRGGLGGTVNELLSKAVARHPDRAYLNFLGPTDAQTITYREFDRRSNRLAHGLLALDVKPGDRVAMLCDSHLDAATLWFATNKCGAIFVPLNTANKGEFLRNPLANSGAEVIVAESEYCDRLRAIEHSLPAARHLVYRGEQPGFSGRIVPRPLAGLYMDDETETGYEPAPTDIAGIIYTGGTTGPSKGCMLSHNYIANLATGYRRLCAVHEGEVIWTSLPFFHLNALTTTLLFAAAVGATAAVSQRFSVTHFWRDIERSGACSIAVLGAMIPLIANAADTPEMIRSRGQVRIAMGAPFPAEMQTIWRERFGVRQAGANLYGLTEASYVTCLPSGESAPGGSSGRRNSDDFDVMIVGPDLNEIPDGEGAGEILVRPKRPQVMFNGYWGRPEETLQVMTDLWFHTGDIGRFDREGFFYFVDRKKDYLRRRGENISSYEMETTFLQHPAIEEVAVHAVPSQFTEDDVKVTAVLRAGMALSELELATWAVDRVPYYAMPRYIEFRSALPKSSVGRILKQELREEGVTGATWDQVDSGFTFSKR